MKITYNRAAIALSCILLLAGCNDEWKDEQYEKYLSFVNSAYTKVYLKYGSEGGKKTYKIPVQVGGSQLISKDVNVTVAVDPDTLANYNRDNYRSREDLYYKQLTPEYYKFNSLTTTIPAKSTQGYLDVEFSFLGLDNYDKYILPLTIEPSSDLMPNPNKGYKKTLMHIILFNDYSGTYQVTSELLELDGTGNPKNEKHKVEERSSWVVDENTVFFYAGMTDENALDRKEYRIYAKFIPHGEDGQTGTVELYGANSNINFDYDPKACSYSIAEAMDPLKPYLKRRYVTMNVSYTYSDITTTPGYPIKYKYVGPMILERVFNILMPEEDQIIW